VINFLLFTAFRGLIAAAAADELTLDAVLASNELNAQAIANCRFVAEVRYREQFGHDVIEDRYSFTMTTAGRDRAAAECQRRRATLDSLTGRPDLENSPYLVHLWVQNEEYLAYRVERQVSPIAVYLRRPGGNYATGFTIAHNTKGDRVNLRASGTPSRSLSDLVADRTFFATVTDENQDFVSICLYWVSTGNLATWIRLDKKRSFIIAEYAEFAHGVEKLQYVKLDYAEFHGSWFPMKVRRWLYSPPAGPDRNQDVAYFDETDVMKVERVTMPDDWFSLHRLRAEDGFPVVLIKEGGISGPTAPCYAFGGGWLDEKDAKSLGLVEKSSKLVADMIRQYQTPSTQPRS
jgi:hypothetical protein